MPLPWELPDTGRKPWEGQEGAQKPSRPWEIPEDSQKPWETPAAAPDALQQQVEPPGVVQSLRDYLSSSYASLPTFGQVLDEAADVLGTPVSDTARAYKQWTGYASSKFQEAAQPELHNTAAAIGKGVLGELGAVPAAIGTFTASLLGALGRFGEKTGFGLGPAEMPAPLPPAHKLPRIPERVSTRPQRADMPTEVVKARAPEDAPPPPPPAPAPYEPEPGKPPSGPPSEPPSGKGAVGGPPSAPSPGPYEPGRLSRYELRDIANILDVAAGKDEARLIETNQWLQQHAPHVIGDTPAGERLYKWREGQNIQLTPEEWTLYEERIRPWEQRNEEIYKDLIKRKSAKVFEEALRELNPSYVHRMTYDSIRRMLGERDYDPAIPFAGARGGTPSSQAAHRFYGLDSPEPSSMQPRKLFRIKSNEGATGVVYIDDGKIFLMRAGQPPHRIMSWPKELEPRPGAEFKYRGGTYRIEQATSDEIESATGIKYHQNLLASVASNYLQLGRFKDALDSVDEFRGYIKDRGLGTEDAAEAKRLGYIKTQYPGLDSVYMPERLAKALDTRIPKVYNEEDPWHWLSRVSQGLQSTLFWWPVAHIGNVAAHSFYERGWRWFLPQADLAFAQSLADAWRAVRSQNQVYRDNVAAGLRLMLGARTANRGIRENMFGDLEKFQTPQGQTLLKQLEALTGIPPASLVKAIYKHAGDALWAGGDVLTLANSLERQRVLKESPREAARAVHKDIPSYRLPMEEIFAGAPGRKIASALSHPATRAGVSFLPYHENVLRGLAMMAEDIGKGIAAGTAKSPKAAKEREEAIEALGKAIVLIGAMWGLQEVPEFKRYGPFSLLQNAVDWLNHKHLSQGAKARVVTGGMYSPSPIAEGAFNLLTGMHAYSLSPIQMHPGDIIYHRGADVPMLDRAQAALGAFIAPIGQAYKLINEPKTETLTEVLGLTQHPRRPEPPPHKPARSKKQRQRPAATQ